MVARKGDWTGCSKARSRLGGRHFFPWRSGCGSHEAVCSSLCMEHICESEFICELFFLNPSINPPGIAPIQGTVQREPPRVVEKLLERKRKKWTRGFRPRKAVI